MDGGISFGLYYFSSLLVFCTRIYLGWCLSLIIFIVSIEIARRGTPADGEKTVRVRMKKFIMKIKRIYNLLFFSQVYRNFFCFFIL